MTREIKFRAKVCKPLRYVVIMPSYRKEGDLVKGDLHLRTQIPHIHEAGNDKFPIEVNTIGQFTGLHDKNGKEIYEGDIIRCYGSKDDEIKHIVEYSDKEAMFCTKLIGAEMLGGSITQRWLNEFEFEVIGNIYDNPELLKGGEE